MLVDIKKTLWATADKLRVNLDAADYKHLVLGLIFVKYISDTFLAKQIELKHRLRDPKDEYYFGEASDAELGKELELRDYYTATNVFWVPESARWEALRAAAKSPDIGKRIDDALTLIETENPKLKGILDKRYARSQLPDGKLGELVDLISTIGFGDNPSVARDILGQVYEYFLGMFANAEGNRVQITQPKRVKAWWFVAENGKCCIAIRYGSKVLELAKGKTAIEVASGEALIDALEAVNAAVIAGELDAQIEAASGQLRSAFVK